MAAGLATTNVLIGVMMAMSVVQTLLIVVAGIAAFGLYRRFATLLSSLDVREMRQTVTKVNGILDEVKAVLQRVDRSVERVDAALHSSMDAAEALGSGVRAKTRWIAGASRGLSVLIRELLRSRLHEQM